MPLSTRQLAELYPEPDKEPATRHADKMVKVYILDKHRRPVSTVAIFIGARGGRMPHTYFYEYRETKLTYRYHTIAIQEQKEEDLLEKKVLMANGLLAKPFPERKIRAIFSFLESYVLFEEPEMNRIFNERTKSSNKSTTMNMTDFVRMEAREEAEEKGREKCARILLANTEFSNEKIAELAEVPLAVVETLSKSVRVGVAEA